MTAKTASAYSAIFTYIRDNLAAYVTPTVIMSNFDATIQSALAYIYPEATVKGYWYEYTSSLIKCMKSLGIQGDKCRGHAASCVRMLLVLPLLPAEYLAPGIDAIRKWAQEKQIFSVQLAQVCSYIEQKWLRTIGADKMSIFGLSHSLHNDTQQFNKELRSALTTTNPLIWQLLECLTQIATRIFIKCSKRQRATPSKPHKNQQVIDAIIKNATQMWIRTPIHLRNPLQFLQLSSHCISDAIGQTHFDEAYLMRSSAASPIPTAIECDTKQRPSTSKNAESSDFIDRQNKYSVHSSAIATVDMCPALVKINYLNAPPIDANASGVARDPPSNSVVSSSSDPPPLAFYPKNQRNSSKAIIFSATQPPPLVPIQRNS